MDEPSTPNGRVTPRDLYRVIGELRHEVTSRLDIIDARLRAVELRQIGDSAADEARTELLSEQREIRSEQGTSRRWLIGIASATLVSVATSVLSLIVAVR